MARIIYTDEVNPDDLSETESDWVYNALDCCITHELLGKLEPQLDNLTRSTYEFEKALQGPVLEMKIRGVLVDQVRREEVLEEYDRGLDILKANIQKFVGEVWGFWDYNPASTKQTQELLYKVIGLPVQMKRRRPTTERAALEKLSQYPIAQPICYHLMAIADIAKKMSFLQTDIDKDGRIRTSYNIAGTETGRFSSSVTEFGTGSNLQNIEDLLRQVLIADPGMKMAYFDAEQGESRVVGAIEYNLFKDARYLDACEGGDLHTTVAKLCWPEDSWTGDLKADKDLAEQPFYRHYSKRFMCKKIGHGSNYGGQPPTLAAQAKVDVQIVREFQEKYFEAFPSHLYWHAWVNQTIRRDKKLVHLTGRRRHFLGRVESDEVLRAAIASDPQGSLADIVNAGMLSVWRAKMVQLLLQMHDAVVVQYHERSEDEVIPRVLKALRYPIELRNGRQLNIPYGCKTGWNFGTFSKSNPEGLKDYKPGDRRKRTPIRSILDR